MSSIQDASISCPLAQEIISLNHLWSLVPSLLLQSSQFLVPSRNNGVIDWYQILISTISTRSHIVLISGIQKNIWWRKWNSMESRSHICSVCIHPTSIQIWSIIHLDLKLLREDVDTYPHIWTQIYDVLTSGSQFNLRPASNLDL